MTRLFLTFLILIVVGTAGCRDFSLNDSGENASPGNKQLEIGFDQQVEMAIGDVVSLAGTGLDITFSLVTEDSRCPLDVQCIQPGKAGILLTVVDANLQRTQLIMLIPGLVATPYRLNSIIQHKGQRFKLLRLDPYPVEGSGTRAQDYRALIVVES
jgi:hypothetical protein